MMVWVNKIGRRNIAYAVFIAVLFPFAMYLEETGPHGPDSGGGVMFGLIVWALVSVVFFVWNLILLIRDLTRGQSAAKPFIACALPVAVIVGTLVIEEVAMDLSSYSADPAVVDDEATQRG